jgi:TonB family protein
VRAFLAILFVLIAVEIISTDALAQANATKLNTQNKGSANFPLIQTEKKVPNTILLPGNKFYPEALSNIGIQGEVKLQLELSTAGKLMSMKILNGSKSPALDEKAQAFMKSSDWKLPDNFPNHVPRVYTQKIIFLKDASSTIDKKTCADFTIDAKYFRSVYPNTHISRVGALDVISGLFTVNLIKTAGGDKALSYVRKRNKISDEAAAACAKYPKNLLLKTYINAANKNGIKF